MIGMNFFCHHIFHESNRKKIHIQKNWHVVFKYVVSDGFAVILFNTSCEILSTLKESNYTIVFLLININMQTISVRLCYQDLWHTRHLLFYVD